MSESWFRIGHVTHAAARTGCTVIRFDQLHPAYVDVRGGAPGTRETSALESGRLVGKADAILLTGGSAFGLGAADGVMRWMFEHGRGWPTAAIPVPIVPAAVIFDLAVGEPIWPDADDGYAATATAGAPDVTQTGQVGAGTGGTVAKLSGNALSGGFGFAQVSVGGVTVSAAVVLNAIGDIYAADGRELAVTSTGQRFPGRHNAMQSLHTPNMRENTSIGCVMIDGVVDRDALTRCAIAAHDALARCVVPAHTIFDGDTFFVVGRSEGECEPARMLALSAITEQAVEDAIVSVFR